MKCQECAYMTEFDRYKTERDDRNDCIVMYCKNKKKRICTYRSYGSLRIGKDARIKTSPRWCPLKESQ